MSSNILLAGIGTPVAIYTSNDGATPVGRVDFNAKILDIGNNVTTGVSVWAFTVPAGGDGQYMMMSNVYSSQNTQRAIDLVKNSVVQAFVYSSTSGQMSLSCSTVIDCVAGDQLAVNTDIAVPLQTGLGQNVVSIYKIG